MQPITVVPSPQAVTEQGGTVELPSDLTMSGSDAAAAAARPLLRVLEDCGAVVTTRRSTDGFIRLVDAPTETEGYRLIINDAGIEVAGSLYGVRHGLQTVLSLLPPQCLMPGSRTVARLPKVTITDQPRFAWRGLLIDVARHFMPITWLRTVVDIAAFHKLNVIHLHLTDDQGWRMPVAAFPRLTTVGGRRRETLVGPAPGTVFDGQPHGGTYTKEELTALVAHARERGVTIVPEIDLPGHMAAAIAAYPEWGNSDEPLDVLTTWGISPDIINTRPATIQALKTILDEVMEVFCSPWIHLGGDEMPTRDWEESPEVADLMQREGIATVRAVQGWVMNQLVAHVERAGRTAIVWDEAAEAGIEKSVIVQAWRSPDAVGRAIQGGYRTIASPQQHYYLDYSTELGENEPLGYGVGKDIATPGEVTWDYRVPDSAFGVEAALWAEYIKTPAKASYQLLPRLALIAERAWGGPERTFEEFQPQLRAQIRRYECMGWDHRPLHGPGQRWARAWHGVGTEMQDD